jgi:hypothetical protein
MVSKTVAYEAVYVDIGNRTIRPDKDARKFFQKRRLFMRAALIGAARKQRTQFDAVNQNHG